MKLVPLCYVLMARRRKADYVAVFEKLKNVFGSFAVKEVMSDFEPAVWAAMRECFPRVKQVGCSFHWAQAVFKTVKKLGLINVNGEKKRTVHRLRRLSYLWEEDIIPVFERLRKEASADLQPLFDYMSRVWIHGRWNPEDWCVFQRDLRTNNHQEGHHAKLNKAVSPNVRKQQ